MLRNLVLSVIVVVLAGTVPHAVAQESKKWPAQRPSVQALKDILLRRGGGNAKSEAAVAAGLQWLARQQAADGHWSLDGTANNSTYDHAATALALLPMLGAGITHQTKDDPLAKNVEGGLQYLVEQQGKDGQFLGHMYAHALASMALCHAYGLTADPKLREPAQKSLDWIVKAQHLGGGWRYTPGTPGDTSVTAWQIQALKFGQLAGLKVPDQCLDGAAKYLDSCQAPDGGYGYLMPRSTPTMTAAGLLSRQYLGWSESNPSLQTGLRTLHQTPPGAVNGLYHEYYATQVMFLAGGKSWPEWNAKIRDVLVGKQDLGDRPGQAHLKGSWSPAGDRFGMNSRVLMTSLAVLTLEVYYRTDLLLERRVPQQVGARDLEELWASLAKEDSLKVRQSMWTLTRNLPEAVRLFGERLRVGPSTTPEELRQIDQLIRDLDSDEFETRETAMQALEKFGGKAEASLRRALDGKPALDLRKRAERLIEKHETAVAAERAQTRRALQVLEQANTAQARELLDRLAKGPDGAWLTREAKATLDRLGKPSRGN